MSVYRCYSQKKPGFDVEAQGLCKALREQLGVAGLTSVAILNRYDADQIDPAVYQQAKGIVFSEPQVDVVYDETFPQPAQLCALLAVEALPGQFDQRADSCAQCIQLMAGVERPLIAYAKVYVLQGQLSQEDLSKIRHYLINPVESREASMDKPETLVRTHETPDHVPTIDGFLTMDEDFSLRLTDIGREVAEQTYEKHCFFTRRLIAAGVDPQTAEREACRMEHTISQRSFELLKGAVEPE